MSNSPPISFLQSLAEDVLAHVPFQKRSLKRNVQLSQFIAVMLFSAGFRCVLLYRFAYLARSRFGFPGRVLASILSWLIRHWYGCALSPCSRIGGGLILPHPRNIVVGPDVRIGMRAWIFHNVTIGGAPGKIGQPIIGNDLRIYPGAVVSGPIQVGDDVVIGANVTISRGIRSSTILRASVAISMDRQVNEQVECVTT
jgi:serine acetyltransferase